jgi:hypothetical protein
MNYPDRIFHLAIVNPEVNTLDADEVEEFARQKAEELFLDPDEIGPKVREIKPTTDDFQKASEIGVQTKDLI